MPRGQKNQMAEARFSDELVRKEMELKELEIRLLKKENELLKTVSKQPTYLFRDLEDSLPTFTGDDDLTILNWINSFEETVKLFQLGELEKLVFVKKLLKGTAALFLRSAEGLISWDILREALIKEFGGEVCVAEIHERLSSTKKKEDESYYQYMLRMKEIGMKGKIDETSLIHYIINGIQDDEFHKSVLYTSKTLDDLKGNLSLYEKMKAITRKKLNDQRYSVQFNKNQSKFSSPLTSHSDKAKKKIERCYICGNKGHKANVCENKEKGFKCFRCNQYGHKATECSNTIKVTNSVNSNSSKDKSKADNNYYSCNCVRILLKNKNISQDSETKVNVEDIKILKPEEDKPKIEDVGEDEKDKDKKKTVVEKYTEDEAILKTLTKEYVQENNEESEKTAKHEGIKSEGIIFEEMKINGEEEVKEVEHENFYLEEEEDVFEGTEEEKEDSEDISAEEMELIDEAEKEELVLTDDENIEAFEAETEEVSVKRRNERVFKRREMYEEVKDDLIKYFEETEINVQETLQEIRKGEQEMRDQNDLEIHQNEETFEEKDLKIVQNEETFEEKEEQETVYRSTREAVRHEAKKQLLKVQAENTKVFKRRRKPATLYHPEDIVAIKRTPFTPSSEVSPKFIGPYNNVRSSAIDRYTLQKVGKGDDPLKTWSSADNMKKEAYENEDIYRPGRTIRRMAEL